MSHIKANRIKYLKETQPSHPRNITFTKTVNVSSNSYQQFSLELSSFKYKHLKKLSHISIPTKEHISNHQPQMRGNTPISTTTNKETFGVEKKTKHNNSVD